MSLTRLCRLSKGQHVKRAEEADLGRRASRFAPEALGRGTGEVKEEIELAPVGLPDCYTIAKLAW